MSKARRADTPRRSDVRAIVLERDGCCWLLKVCPEHQCRGEDGPHHLQKASQGGPYEEWNLLTLCASANVAVEDFPCWARARGLVVDRTTNAFEAAALRAKLEASATRYRPH